MLTLHNVYLPNQSFEFICCLDSITVTQTFPNDIKVAYVLSLFSGRALQSRLREVGWYDADGSDFDKLPTKVE